MTWLELDAAHAQVFINTTDAPLTALLGAPLGQGMVQSAIAAITTLGNMRVSPCGRAARARSYSTYPWLIAGFDATDTFEVAAFDASSGDKLDVRFR